MSTVVSSYNIKMSSNKFLQRFEGKIQVVSKQGVHNVFGKSENVVVVTNNNFNPNKNRTNNSLNKSKPNQEPTKQVKNQKNQRKSQKNNEQPQKDIHKNTPPVAAKEKKMQNPFLISNPFYLDEEDRERQEEEKRERERQQKIQKQKQKERQRQMQKQAIDSKKTTTANISKSLEKKKTEKEWVKMGGLGANIGGDQWVEKKKKLQKMQEFSEQVKSINKDKPKIPKPSDKKDQKKQANTRQKALQYSKNVPKPAVRVLQSQKQQQTVQRQQVAEQKLSELQLYQLRHQQLKNMLKNQM